MPKISSSHLLSEARNFLEHYDGLAGKAWVAEIADALESEVARADRLTAILDVAPHGPSCLAYGDSNPERWATVAEWCNCWKARL